MTKIQTYAIPVYWEVKGLIEIEATSKEEALSLARANLDSFPLPKNAEYMEDSFELDDLDDEELLETIFLVHNKEVK